MAIKTSNSVMVSIINYGMGNLKSIQNALNYLEIDNQIIHSYKDIVNAEKLILPGVGSFKKAMVELNKLNLISTLKEEIKIKKKPILGICLGMQLLSEWGEEGNVDGLGLIKGQVKKFDLKKNKIPHVGFNNISIKRHSILLDCIDDNSDFYFVHSYHFSLEDQNNILATTFYEDKFISAVEKENIFGVQFHPEKSQKNGLQILKNFDKI